MKPIVGPLLPPNTPTGLPHGNERGGVFDAPYVPGQYIDARRKTVPTDSPMSPNVTSDVFTRPVSFTDPNTPRTITGGERQFVAGGTVAGSTVLKPVQGMGYVSHRGHVSPFGRHPQGVPFGRHIQGMGPTRGYIVENAGPPPLPIGPGHPVATPHGMTEGGIFGQQAVTGGMATGGRVPGVPTKDIMVERTVRPLTGYGYAGMRGFRGFGSGPDGLGG